MNVSRDGLVYSGDLKGSVDVVYEKIPITTLSNEQELQLTAFIRAGRGSEHSKFSPGLVFYRNVSEITLDKDIYNEIKGIFPENDAKEKGNKITIIDNRKKEVLDFCEGAASKRGRKAEVVTKNELVMTIESFGQIDADDIFKRSIDALRKDFLAVQKGVDKI